jgi:anti-repressor protein
LTDNNGDPWLIAKDVCDVLGLATNHLRESLDSDEITNLRITEVGENGGREPLIVSESGFYKLVMRSRKPEAKEFQRWVTHEVLPQIRKTGGYIPVAPTDDDKTILSKALLIMQTTLDKKDSLIASQSKTIEAQRPLATLGESFLSTDGTMTVTKAARHFQTIDRSMTRDLVFGLLRGAGYLEQHSNAPTIKAIQPGYLRQKVGTRRDGKMGAEYAVFTPKGINWFIRRFIFSDSQGRFDIEGETR